MRANKDLKKPQIIKEKSKKTKIEVRIMSSNVDVNHFT